MRTSLLEICAGACLALILYVDPALSQPRPKLQDCLIKIDGKVYDSSPCNLFHEDDLLIQFGTMSSDGDIGYWVHLLKELDGRYLAHWNEEYGASHAHSRLGIVVRETREAGVCFINERVRLCGNIPRGTAIFYEDPDPDMSGGRLRFRYQNGQEIPLKIRDDN